MKLPINDPIFIHSPKDTYLNMILSRNNEMYEWMMEEFINTCITKEGTFDNFYNWRRWFNCPFIDKFVLPRNARSLVVRENVVEFFLDLLNHGFYIYTVFLNTKYLSAYRSNKNDNHNLFIYGYNLEKNFFYSCDFYDTVFGHKQLDFKQVQLAYDHYDDVNGSSEYGNTLGIKIKKSGSVKYEFNKEVFNTKIVNYLNSTNLLEITGNKEFDEEKNKYVDEIFGIKIFHHLIDLYKTNSYFSFRPLNLLYTKSLIMKYRLLFLFQKNYISKKIYMELLEMCEQLIQKSKAIRNSFIKMNLKNVTLYQKEQFTKEEIEKIEKSLRNLCSDEEKFYERLVKI